MFASIKRLSFKHKHNKFSYYLVNYLRQLVPAWVYHLRLNARLKPAKSMDLAYINQRVAYYNRLSGQPRPLVDPMTIADLRWPRKLKAYHFDTFETARFFPFSFKLNVCFGDVTFIPGQPSLVKSRPIQGDNANAVLLKINKNRHFLFVNDKRAYAEKEGKLIGRCNINQDHRARFMDQYFTHPLCDVGDVSTRVLYPQWQKPRLTLDEHLKYKFILCLEGHDVASNLKWVMSSNSLAVMPRPTYETWFMEGTLIPDYHYVAIKDDYSDLEARLRYYLEHEEEAKAIVRQANDFVKPFRDKQQESLIATLVLKKYFVQTNQWKTEA